MTNDERCKIKVWDRGRGTFYHVCDRPVKGKLIDGAPACGVHIAAEKRTLERQALTKERADADANNLRNAHIAAERLRALGVKSADTHYHTDPRGFRHSGFTGKVVLDPDELLPLLEKRGKR